MMFLKIRNVFNLHVNIKKRAVVRQPSLHRIQASCDDPEFVGSIKIPILTQLRKQCGFHTLEIFNDIIGHEADRMDVESVQCSLVWMEYGFAGLLYQVSGEAEKILVADHTVQPAAVPPLVYLE